MLFKAFNSSYNSMIIYKWSPPTVPIRFSVYSGNRCANLKISAEAGHKRLGIVTSCSTKLPALEGCNLFCHDVPKLKMHTERILELCVPLRSTLNANFSCLQFASDWTESALSVWIPHHNILTFFVIGFLPAGVTNRFTYCNLLNTMLHQDLRRSSPEINNLL